MTTTIVEIDKPSIEAAKKRMTRCMFRMFQEFPFWAFLIEKCDVRIVPGENKDIPTACVTKSGIIYFNHSFLSSISDSMVHFVLAHEVMHLLLDHHFRVGIREGFLWNVSSDLLINEMLKEHFAEKNVPLDLTNYVNSQTIGVHIDHNTVTTEEVYEILLKGSHKVKCYKDALADDENNPLSKGVTGSGDLAQDDVAGDSQSYVIREGSETTPSSGKEWSEAGLEAATRSRLAGHCPDFMERIIDKLLNATISWNEVLASYLRRKFCMRGGSKHTFTPPNRRYLYQDILLTSRVGRKKPSIAFSIDTSGSMSPEDISKGIAEMNAIRHMYKIPIYLLEADAAVNRAQWVSPYQEIPSLKGGGGTSFVPVMEHIKENKPDIDLLVYFTDGEGEFGPDPGFDVLWVINGSAKAPYGQTVTVS
jgi:predicted metal-dependent peptidase